MITQVKSTEKNANHIFWKIFVLVVILLYTPRVFSQDRFIMEIGMGYPFPEKDFFSSYNGIISISASASYKIFNQLYAGISFNYNSTKQKNPETYTRYYTPSAIIKYQLKIIKKLLIIPEIGIGTSILSFKCRDYQYNDNQIGLDVNGKIALGYALNNRINILVFYRLNYIHLQYDNEFTVLTVYRNLHISNIGASINIIL